ncbi:thioesterase family protein [Maricurvus nonylphenolicus]|uniref:acyl-CoA thioesterase n=1 Tax=Maricurvus nonylphenolicus TaxID=1008307 RepID=UPI0036F43973
MHFETVIKPKFGELDVLGHINNVAILDWLQEARWQFYREVFDFRLQLVSVRAEIDYHAQITIENDVTIKTWVESIGNSSIKFSHQVLQSDQLCSSSLATMVLYDSQEQCSANIDDETRTKLKRFMPNIK